MASLSCLSLRNIPEKAEASCSSSSKKCSCWRTAFGNMFTSSVTSRAASHAAAGQNPTNVRCASKSVRCDLQQHISNLNLQGRAKVQMPHSSRSTKTIDQLHNGTLTCGQTRSQRVPDTPNDFTTDALAQSIIAVLMFALAFRCRYFHV